MLQGEDKPPPLAYCKPSPPVSTSRVLGGLFGVVAGVAALLVGALGLWVMIHALFIGYKADRAADAYQAAVLLAIAAALGIAGLRWCRRAFGRGENHHRATGG